MSCGRAERRWGRIRFKVYELLIFHSWTLPILESYEKLLNRHGWTLCPLDAIRSMREKIREKLESLNLRNPWVLVKRKMLTLTMMEWKVLQNSLCVTIGMKEKGLLDISEGVMEKVRRLHRRFELFPVRIIAAYKGLGYRVDEKKARELIESYKSHDPENAIRPLKDRDSR